MECFVPIDTKSCSCSHSMASMLECHPLFHDRRADSAEWSGANCDIRLYPTISEQNPQQ
jgi:hypothetical protein